MIAVYVTTSGEPVYFWPGSLSVLISFTLSRNANTWFFRSWRCVRLGQLWSPAIVQWVSKTDSVPSLQRETSHRLYNVVILNCNPPFQIQQSWHFAVWTLLQSFKPVSAIWCQVLALLILYPCVGIYLGLSIKLWLLYLWWGEVLGVWHGVRIGSCNYWSMASLLCSHVTLRFTDHKPMLLVLLFVAGWCYDPVAVGHLEYCLHFLSWRCFVVMRSNKPSWTTPDFGWTMKGSNSANVEHQGVFNKFKQGKSFKNCQNGFSWTQGPKRLWVNAERWNPCGGYASLGIVIKSPFCVDPWFKFDTLNTHRKAEPMRLTER